MADGAGMPGAFVVVNVNGNGRGGLETGEADQ
jgi:hypothetical protein